MNPALLLLRSATADGRRPALLHGQHVVADYAALAQRSAGLAGALRGPCRLSPGDRVALFMTNVPDYVTVLFAAWWAGLVVVPVNAKLHSEELGYILADSGARVCFVTPDLATQAGRSAPVQAGQTSLIEVGGQDWMRLQRHDVFGAPQQMLAGDLAWLFYTSGTTGRPKGAMLSCRNLMTMIACYFTDVDTIGPGDCVLHAAPMSHGSGMYILPHVLAAAANVVPESGGFDTAEIGNICAEMSGVSFFAAPTMVHRMVRDPALDSRSMSGLKTVVYGGGPMYAADILAALDRFGPRFAQIYGQGESPMTITALNRSRHGIDGTPDRDARLASVGVRQSLVEIRIGDEAGSDLAVGETGEVMARGPSVMLGYWQQPEATANAIVDGWLRTGDMGSVDAYGFLTLRDRSRDVIISGGTNIYPREVEECLLLHPAVAEVSVIGRPDPEWGEDVVAFIVPRNGSVDPAALDAHCLTRIARFKRPKDYRIVEALPKNNYGKVLKTTLRQWLTAADQKGSRA